MKLRQDLVQIASWIDREVRLLDLGCGDGALLAHLRDSHRCTGYGIEIDDASVLACVRADVSVVQADLESGLRMFADAMFDTVVLSQTLQAMHNTASVLGEMLRVGREGIVSFPNFGYWRNRLQVLAGHMPVSPDLPFAWHDTPNVHLCTLQDFEGLCTTLGARVDERQVLTRGAPVTRLPNLLGSVALYRVSRRA